MNQERTVSLKEIRERVESCDIVCTKIGNSYIQCIKCELTDTERRYLVNELDCISMPFKEGLKIRFYLPSNVKLVKD